MSLLLAEIESPLHRISTSNTMIPLAVFMVLNFVLQFFVGRSHRASLAKMSPEEKVKLMEAQATGGTAGSFMILLFILAMVALTTFSNGLSPWFLPLFTAAIALFLITQAFASRASRKRMEAAGVPADYIRIRRKQSLVSSTLLTLFMGWLVINTWVTLGDLQEQLNRLKADRVQHEQEYQEEQKQREERIRELKLKNQGH
jgi:hypothetical protein